MFKIIFIVVVLILTENKGVQLFYNPNFLLYFLGFYSETEQINLLIK